MKVYVLFSDGFLSYPFTKQQNIIQGIFSSFKKANEYMENMIYLGRGICSMEDFHVESYDVDQVYNID